MLDIGTQVGLNDSAKSSPRTEKWGTRGSLRKNSRWAEPRTGRRINFAPMGTALLWSPFYLLMHGGVLASRAAGACRFIASST